MNDDFLHTWREPPRAEFARALYAQLSEQEADKMPAHTQSTAAMLRRLASVFGLTGLVMAGILLASPVARAQVTRWLGEVITVGGVNFKTVDATPFSGGTPVTRPSVESLDAAQAAVPEPLLVPTWVPEGFALQDSVAVNQALADANSPFLATVTLTWKNPVNNQVIFQEVLYFRPSEFGPGLWNMSPGGTAEEVEVNGQPAALVQEDVWWDFEDGEERTTGALKLLWSQTDTVLYRFIAPEGSATAEALIQMAESIQ
jgi:hypothetical protein